MKTAGAEGKPTVFLITDTQIKEESFLEDIDNLLNTGEVPNLYAVDEKQEIMEVIDGFINWQNMKTIVITAEYVCLVNMQKVNSYKIAQKSSEKG